MTVSLSVKTDIRGIEENAIITFGHGTSRINYANVSRKVRSFEEVKSVRLMCLPNGTILLNRQVVTSRHLEQLSEDNVKKITDTKRMSLSIGRVCNIDISGDDVDASFPDGEIAYLIN